MGSPGAASPFLKDQYIKVWKERLPERARLIRAEWPPLEWDPVTPPLQGDGGENSSPRLQRGAGIPPLTRSRSGFLLSPPL